MEKRLSEIQKNKSEDKSIFIIIRLFVDKSYINKLLEKHG